MKLTAATVLLGVLATALVVSGQKKKPKPSALQNVTITSVDDGDYYSLNVDFDYSGSGVCKCDVKTVQGRKKKSFGSVKQCLDKFSMSVEEGMYSVDIKCKSGKTSMTVAVPELKECPTLEDIPNGSVDMTGVTVGSTATYTCNEYYQLKGTSTRMCQPDGTWSGEEPMCIVPREKMCKSLETLAHNILTTTQGATCTVSANCLDLTCTGRRSFGAIQNLPFVATIHLFPCANPPTFRFRVDGVGRTIMDGVFSKTTNVTGRLNAIPYEITISITQLPSGVTLAVDMEILGRKVPLSPAGPTSVIHMSCPKDCGHPGEIDNGQVDVSGGTMIGDTANYQCNEHFQLKGDNTRTCQEDGTWSGTPPTCLVPFESMCESHRNLGKVLEEQSGGTCVLSNKCRTMHCSVERDLVPGQPANTNFSQTLVPCPSPYGVLFRPVTTGPPFFLNGGTSISNVPGPIPGTVAEIQVHTDILPYGVAISSITRFGDEEIANIPLTELKMSCTCPLLPDISDGTVTQPEVATVGATASYKCNPTYSLNWPPFRTCLPDGTWDRREPTCRTTWKGMCASGQESVNRTLSQQAVSGQCNMSEDCLTTQCSLVISVAFFKIPVRLTSMALPCSRPYGIVVQSSGSPLSGSVSGTFTESTNVTGRAGVLEVTVTYEIEQMEKGILVGATAKIKGSPSVIVLIPTSELVMHCVCPALDNIAHGSIRLTNNYEIESSAIHTCDDMYELDGPLIRVCQSDGTWSKTEPKCKPTKEAMCNAQYLIANQTQQRDELSGSCNVSDDCTATECSLGIAFGQVLTYLTASITYYPCSTPYSFNAYTSVPAIGLTVNETITHSRCILIGGENKLCFIVTQEPYRLIYSMRASFGRQVFPSPVFTVPMYCEAER